MPERSTLLTPLRSADYRRLWIAQAISIIGDKIDQLAMSVVVFRITGSALQMGIMLAVTMLPSALLGLVVAPVVDRLDYRRTMIAADLARAGIVAIIPFVAGLSGVSAGVRVAGVYVLAFLVSTVSLFFEPSRLALMPAIVDPDHLMAANSLDSTTNSVAELAGIGVGAALVAAVGYRTAFALDALSFLVSAVFILRVRHRRVAPRSAPFDLGSLTAELRDAARHISGRPVLRDLVGLYAVGALGASASVTLCFVLALTGFQGLAMSDAVRLAIIDTATTIGLVAGGVLVGMSGSRGAGAKFLWGLLAFGALFAAASTVRVIWLSAAVLCAAGVANIWFQVPMLTIIQRTADEGYLGRVFALRTTLVRVVGVFGLLGAGLLAERVGVFAAIAVSGGLVVIVALAGLTRRELREA